MTVSSETAKSGPYTGNGVTTVFAYGFRILDAGHIEVIRTVAGTASTVSPSEYTVSGVGDLGGGNVTFTIAPVAGQSITIIRNAPFTQQTDLENQGAYYAETIEEALDLAAMRDQQMAEELARAVTIPVGEDASTLDTLVEDIIRLKDSADEIDAVAGISGNVTTVAGIAADVTTVAGVAASVPTVAGVSEDVTTVAGIAASVTTVAGVAASVPTVAGVSEDVTTVAGIAASVTTVAGVSEDVSTVAANLADVTNFADVYLGPAAANPTLRNDGTALQEGDLYFNTVAGQMRVYDGAAWVAASSAVNGTTRRQSFTATAGQTVFTITGGYDPGFADVYLNGVKLVNGVDVAVTSGANVVLAVGATVGDSVDVVAYGAFQVADTYTQAEVDGFLAGKFTKRTITGTANQITVSNGDGVSGDPVIAAVVASQAEAEAGTGAGLMTSERTAQAIVAQRGQFLHVVDEKAPGDSGGTFTSGAYRTRTLNTVRTNTIAGASLGSNQITLPAGTYKCLAQAPAYRVEGHVAILRQVSGTPVTLIHGTNAYSGDSSLNSNTSSYVEGVFTLVDTQIIELQHRCNTSISTYGLGTNGGTTWAPAIFATVLLEKIA